MAKPQYPNLHKAIKAAVKAHKKQDSDGEHPIPYVTHPIDVLNLLRWEVGVLDENMLCAAILHDVLEVTDMTEKQIEKNFGSEVRRLVKELTREAPTPEQMQMPEEERWKIRSQAMMNEIDNMSDASKTIKLADRCSNVRSALKTRTGQKLERYLGQSREILEHIPREISPVLWDKVQRLVNEAEEAPPKRKNLRANGAPANVS